MSMLHELLTEAWERRPEADPSEIAGEVVGVARTRAELIDLVLPAVAAQAMVVKRHRVRQVEDAAFGQATGANHSGSAEQASSTDDYLDPLTARRQIMTKGCYVNNELGWVPWGEMTSEMHTMRADYLERKAHGHLVTADRHRTAAKFIAEAGVSCLNDLPSIPDELFEGVAA